MHYQGSDHPVPHRSQRECDGCMTKSAHTSRIRDRDGTFTYTSHSSALNSGLEEQMASICLYVGTKCSRNRGFTVAVSLQNASSLTRSISSWSEPEVGRPQALQRHSSMFSSSRASFLRASRKVQSIQETRILPLMPISLIAYKLHSFLLEFYDKRAFGTQSW